MGKDRETPAHILKSTTQNLSLSLSKKNEEKNYINRLPLFLHLWQTNTQTLFPLFLSFSFVLSFMESPSRCSVIIIGAGVSGKVSNSVINLGRRLFFPFYLLFVFWFLLLFFSGFEKVFRRRRYWRRTA